MISMALSAEDKEELVGLIGETLNRRRTMDEDRHCNDHKFIYTLMQREKRLEETKKRRHELLMTARKTAVGWIVVAVLTLITGLGTMVYDFIAVLVRKLMNL